MDDKKKKAFIINLLRRGTFRWTPRGNAKKKAKVKVGEFKTGRAKYGYQCNICKDVFMSKEVKADHISAVVCPLDGFQGFDIYIERMYCEESNFQIVCPICHDEKTAMERDFKARAKDLKAKGESLDKLRKEYSKFLKGFK